MKKFAAHEMLEVHELLSAKNLSIQKGSAYLQMAQDADLKSLIQNSLHDGQQMLTQLQQVLGGI